MSGFALELELADAHIELLGHFAGYAGQFQPLRAAFRRYVELPRLSRGDVERDGGKRRLQWIATQGPIQRAALVARTRYTHRHAITPRMQQKQLTS